MRDEMGSRRDFESCIEFHGHTCPGLAVGFRASLALMERLGVRKAPDEELVAVVETDACGADAIQVMTGCTLGKGNFILKNYGKHAFSLLDRSKGKGVRVCLRPDAFQMDPESLSLSEKVRNDRAIEDEMKRFAQVQNERVKKILSVDSEVLFKIEDISPDLPAKARIMKSGVCDFCGEAARIDLLRAIDGKSACIPCAEQQGS